MQKTPIAMMLLALTTQGFAAPAQDSNTSDSKNYDPSLLNVPISDTRSPTGTKSAISSTTYMNREQIQQTGAHSVDQLLQDIAGFTVSRSGGPGSQTSIYLRGAEADALLVLVDGVRIQSANTGLSALTDLPLTTIESIEVIRGPQSTIYGSAAPGGIIKITTVPSSQRTSARISESISNDGDLQTAASASGAVNDKVNIFSHLNWSNREGVDACNAVGNPCYSTTPEDDLDGFEQLNGQFGLQYFGDNGRRFQFSHMYNKGRSEYDGDYSNEAVNIQQMTNVQFKENLNMHNSLSVDFGKFNEDYETFLDANGTTSPYGTYGTDRYTGSLVHEVHSPSPSGRSTLALTSGVDYDDTTLVDFDSGFSTLPEINRQTTGIFTEFEYVENGATLRLGIRRDMYRSVGETETTRRYSTTGHMKLQLKLDDHWTIKSSLGRNFNMPTFTDLYYPFSSNPNLKPEVHVSQDLGVEFSDGAYRASAFLFRTKSRDLIVYQYDPATFTGSTFNINKAKIQGLELMQSYTLNNFQAQGNITYLNARNASEGELDYHLPRRPELQFTGSLSYTYDKWSSRLGVISSGKRFDRINNANEVGGFTTYNLGFKHQTTPDLSLGVRLDNLFDKEYQTVSGYNQPDRTLWFDLEYAIH